MTQAEADTLAASRKTFFCDIAGLRPDDVDGWIDPTTNSLHLCVKTRGYVAGVAVTTFVERIKAEDWCVGPSEGGVHFLFRLPE